MFRELLSRMEAITKENERLRQATVCTIAYNTEAPHNHSLNLQCLFPLIAESLKDKPNRINQLKEIRTLTGASLKDAKDMLMAVYASVNKGWLP